MTASFQVNQLLDILDIRRGVVHSPDTRSPASTDRMTLSHSGYVDPSACWISSADGWCLRSVKWLMRIDRRSCFRPVYPTLADNSCQLSWNGSARYAAHAEQAAITPGRLRSLRRQRIASLQQLLTTLSNRCPLRTPYLATERRASCAALSASQRGTQSRSRGR
jgi:hypothetical protein